MTEFDPTLVSAVLEADKAMTGRTWDAWEVEDARWSFGNTEVSPDGLDEATAQGVALFRTAAPILARRVMELEADNEKWFQVWSADITKITGERDRAFALMAEMDSHITRGREAEAIVRELADETENSRNGDELCGSCGVYSVARGYEVHESDCLVLRARAWSEQNG